MQKIIPSALFLIVVLHLVACSDVAVTGAQMVYNRRSIENNVTDQYRAKRIYQALYLKSDDFNNANITVAVYNNELLLAGQVPEAWQRTKAEELAKKAAAVSEVHNLIAIASPASSLTHMSDAWITTKVKTNLIASSEVDASKVKVVTENGTVYLMGVLPLAEANKAAEIASNTGGVQSVVKVFSYLVSTKTLKA